MAMRKATFSHPAPDIQVFIKSKIKIAQIVQYNIYFSILIYYSNYFNPYNIGVKWNFVEYDT